MDAPPATSTIDVSHFSPEQQATPTELLRLIPENIVRGLFSGVNPQDQIIVIESFRLHGEATAQSAAHAAVKRTQEEAALLYEADLLKATAKNAGLEDLKCGGAPDEYLFRWVSEVKLALGAQLVTNETLRVAFALSNLQGRALDWAYNLHMLDDEAFPSFESLVEQLKEQYVHSNVETRFRAKFYQAKQGKGTIQEFVNELRSILGSFENSYRIDEIGRVTVFMYGPARDELFRLQPQGFNERACRVSHPTSPPTWRSRVWRRPLAMSAAVSTVASPVTLQENALNLRWRGRIRTPSHAARSVAPIVGAVVALATTRGKTNPSRRGAAYWDNPGF
ncbi:hypothetical protein AeMF1_006565 [Aphanomyces euteiches]|nr:hypothetical protein AeMF1_006565 [Aphanomyces euteiches]